MPKGWCQILIVVPSNRTQSNGCKLNHKKFLLYMKKKSTVRVAEHWKRLPRVVLESPSLKTFHPPGDIPVSPALSDPPWQGHWTGWVFGAFQPWLCYYSVPYYDPLSELACNMWKHFIMRQRGPYLPEFFPLGANFFIFLF